MAVLNGKRRSVVPANAMVINNAPMISAQTANDMSTARLECTTSARNACNYPSAKGTQVLPRVMCDSRLTGYADCPDAMRRS